MAAKEIPWREGLTLEQDPDDIEYWSVEWKRWLRQETLGATEYKVMPAGELTVTSFSMGSTADEVAVGGAPVAGKTYKVRCRATSSLGRKKDRSIYFRIRES